MILFRHNHTEKICFEVAEKLFKERFYKDFTKSFNHKFYTEDGELSKNTGKLKWVTTHQK